MVKAAAGTPAAGTSAVRAPAVGMPAAGTPQRPRRAIVLVGNPAAPYSRGLRIARALASDGYAVEIAAVAGEGLPDEEWDGAIRIRRYRPSGPFAPMSATYREPDARRLAQARGRPSPVRVLRRLAGALRRWAFWPHTVRGWWATLERDLEPADLYHACGSLTIAAALRARARDRRAGRTSVVLYDAIDDLVGGNNVIGMPRPVRAWIGRREARWARAADGRLTVNDALAERLSVRWSLTSPPMVVPNWPDMPPADSQPSGDLIRARLGLPASTRIILFQGRLGPNLGLDEIAEAVLLVPDAALVLIGFGRGFEACQARDHAARFSGRHFTLPAIHPDELLAWTASADVCVVPLPPVSENQRASTPNKFWESIAAGTPVVVGPGLPVMGDLVRRHELGAIATSLQPGALAAAVQGVLEADGPRAADRRQRIARVAREQFSWPVAAQRYLALVAMASSGGGGTGH